MEKVFLKRGVEDAKIVIPQNAHVVEKTASEELCNYIEKSLGIKLPIICECKAEGKCIYVGHTEFAKKNNVLGKSKENWIIKMVDGSLVLSGGVNRGDRGIIYAAYHFLEENLGVRWWNGLEEDVLTLDEFKIAEDFEKEGTPYFPYRKPLTDILIGLDNADAEKGAADGADSSSVPGMEKYPFIPRSRINVLSPLDDNIESVYEPIVRKHGDMLTHGRPHHVHVLGKLFPKAETHAEHPEWMAWNEDKKERLKLGHYCLSNEEFYNALMEKLLGFIKEDVELAEKTGVELPYYYSLSFDDLDAEYFFCHCPECKKKIEKSGVTGYALQFINRVARDVKKLYPWVKIEFLAYVVFVHPPKDDTVPEENVVIRIAGDRADMTHGFVEPANRPYLDKLKTWSKLCKVNGAELQIWKYMFNLQMNFACPLVFGLQNFIQTYRDYGVKGIFVEIEKFSSDCHDLNVYVLTRLLEDPDCDVETLIADFCDRYYGKAGKAVCEYLYVLRDAQNRNVVHTYCMCDDSPFNYIDARAAIDGTAALDRATEAVGDEMPYRARLNWLRKTFDAVMLNRYFDFKHQAEENGEKFEYDFKTMKKRIVDAINENYTRMPVEGGSAIARITPPEDEIEYYSNLPEEEEILDIPEYFKDINPKDIYQFRMADITKAADKRLRHTFGFWPERDPDTTVSKSLKISFDNCRGSQKDYIMVATPKASENPKSINFGLYQDDAFVEGIKLYRDDFVQGGYNIYKVGHVDNISSYPDTHLVGYDYGFLSIKIRGIAVTFPMEACDVYLSIKPSGEMYGGKAGDENALFIDRLIVVRTK